MVDAEKTEMLKDLNEFDDGLIVMARPLIQSISKMAAVVSRSRFTVVIIYNSGLRMEEAGSCGLIEQTSYRSSNYWKS